MNDQIYLIDPATKSPLDLTRASFSDIGMKERADFQEWILAHPQMLGEELLIITSEFDRFNRSNNRLDIMALDKQGVLTIIELKLDANRTLADLQAIRYAAFCSTMTMQDVLEQFALWKKILVSEATEIILTFLDTEDLPELNAQPRIILAAGTIEDQELTSTVLWLRRFQVDISCVELTPYHLGELGRIVLVPRILIPLPEAREYLVSVERKEAARIQQTRQDKGYSALWRAIAEAFNQLDCPFKASARQVAYMPLRIKIPQVHYEWMIQKSSNALDICLHSEFNNREESLSHIAPVLQQWDELTQGINLEKFAGPWGRKWAQAYLRVPYSEVMPLDELAGDAASTMKLLFDRTYPTLMEMYNPPALEAAQNT